MEEPKTWREIRNDGGRFMRSRPERGGRARFVMVLQEPREFVLKIEPGHEMLAHRRDGSLTQTVVQAFVIRVIKSLLLQPPFEVPIDLGHEQELGGLAAHAANRPRPELFRPAAPCAIEDVGQDEHCHVAPNAIGPVGNRHEDVAHGVLHLRIAVIELQRI